MLVIKMQPKFVQCKWPEWGGFEVCVDGDSPDSYTDTIANSTQPEAPLRYLLRTLKKNEKVIDLGANVGFFAHALAHQGAQVLAVEAMPKNVRLLSLGAHHNRKIQLKNLFGEAPGRVYPVQAAVSDQVGTLKMSSYSAWAFVSDEGEVSVPATTLDDLASTYAFDDCDTLKIDVEGSELAVLLGAEEFLKSRPNLKILFEANAFTAINFDYNMQNLLEKFEAHGFSLYMFWENLLIPRKASDLQEPVIVDYLAVRNPALTDHAGFSVRALTFEEQVNMILHQPRYARTSHRAYFLSIEDKMPSELREHPEVRELLDQLKQSDEPDLQEFAAQFRSNLYV